MGNALLAVTAKGSEAIVMVLLEKGANPNVKGGRHYTALQVAAAKGFVDIVKLSLEKGADPCVQGGKYGTALHPSARPLPDSGRSARTLQLRHFLCPQPTIIHTNANREVNCVANHLIHPHLCHRWLKWCTLANLSCQLT